MNIQQLTGNIHIHTPFSDGNLYHAEIAEAASMAGLDFVIVTDHNVWVDGPEGYYDNVLLLVGEEVHDARRQPQVNHCLIYGAECELSTYAESPQGLINAARERNALTFIAHPIDASLKFMHEDGLPWVDWELEGYTGVELWNYMSEFKGRLPNRLMAIWYAYQPQRLIRGPFRQALDLWDDLLARGQRVVAIGSADAHGNTFTLGPFTRTLFDYDYLFRCINVHILIDRPLHRDVQADKQMIYHALAQGRCWIAYDLLGDSRGFHFVARSMANTAGIGEDLKRAAAVTFEVQTPARSNIRLIRADYGVVAASNGHSLKYVSAEPGVYRVEVYRGGRGWIFTNPIYVH
jgi:hypothetical protein